MSCRHWLNPVHPAQLVLGFSVWSIWFLVMYAGLSVACQLTPPMQQNGANTWLNIALWSTTLLVVALLSALAWRCRRYCRNADNLSRTQQFIGYVATVLYMLAAVATLAGGLPVLVFRPCI